MRQKNKLAGLDAATKARSEECIRHANAAIDVLKSNGQKITYVSVANASGVSRTTLYRMDVIRERIESLKALGKKDEKSIKRCVVTDGLDRERQLRNEIAKLKKDKRSLVDQLLDQQELLDENNKLRIMIQRLKEQQRSEQ